MRKRLKARLAATDRARVKKTSHSFGAVADQEGLQPYPCRDRHQATEQPTDDPHLASPSRHNAMLILYNI
jgi:hypothetical protein